MAWVRLSDDFYDHPKFQRVGALGVALWAEGLAWSNRNLSDGRIPRNVARRLVDFEEVAETVMDAVGNAGGNGVTNGVCNAADNRGDYALAASILRQNTIIGLVKAGLWEETDGGYLIHDYIDYQKTAAQITAERDKNAARQKAFKDRKKRGAAATPPVANGPADAVGNAISNGTGNGVTDGVTNGPVTDAPNPNPNTSSSYEEEGDSPGSEIPDEKPVREDVQQVCAALADAIEANGSKRPTITKTWHAEARLLMDKDGRTFEQILAAIAWCQNDSFWRANVLSMPKLRQQYDQLRLAAQRNQPTRPPGTAAATYGQQEDSGDLFDRAMARAATRRATAQEGQLN